MVLMKCNDTYLVDNQRKILALFLDHPKKFDLLFCVPIASVDPRQEEMDGKKKIMYNELNFEPVVNLEDKFYQDEPYGYHSKMLRLLTYSCAGKSGVYVNELKIRDLFSLEYLVNILFFEDSMTEQSDRRRHVDFNKSNDSGGDDRDETKKTKASGIRAQKGLNKNVRTKI